MAETITITANRSTGIIYIETGDQCVKVKHQQIENLIFGLKDAKAFLTYNSVIKKIEVP